MSSIHTFRVYVSDMKVFALTAGQYRLLIDLSSVDIAWNFKYCDTMWETYVTERQNAMKNTVWK